MNTIQNRVRSDTDYAFARVMHRNDGGCMAILKLGTTWAKSGRSVVCSFPAVADSLFCGRHDHLLAIFGDTDGYLDRAFARAGTRGLMFDWDDGKS